jgi:hypothetical protein
MPVDPNSIGSKRKYYLGQDASGAPILLTNYHGHRAGTLYRKDAKPQVSAELGDIEVIHEVILDDQGRPIVTKDTPIPSGENEPQPDKRAAETEAAATARPSGSVLFSGQEEWENELPPQLTFSDAGNGTYADGSVVLTGLIPYKSAAQLIAPDSIIGSGLNITKQGGKRFVKAHDLATFIVKKDKKGRKAARADRAKQAVSNAAQKESRSRYSGKPSKPTGAREVVSKEIERERARAARQRNSAKRREGTNKRRES